MTQVVLGRSVKRIFVVDIKILVGKIILIDVVFLKEIYDWENYIELVDQVTKVNFKHR